MKKSEITNKQREILDYINLYIDKKGFSPSLRDIANHFGFKSVSTAQFHVNSLAKKSLIKKKDSLARGIGITQNTSDFIEVPLLGVVTAGIPIEARKEQNSDFIKIPKTMTRSEGKYFILRVEGDSMEGKGILDRDLVLIREQTHCDNGDIVVVANRNWEVTLKEILIMGNKAYLKPANKKYQIYYHDLGECQVVGKMVGLLRQGH